MPSATHRTVLNRLLLILIVTSAAWALILALTGGFDLRPYGIPFRSRGPDRLVYAGILLTAAYAYWYREHARRDFTRIVAWTRPLAGIEAHARTTAILIALVTGVLGVTHGVLVAGGADSYGYVSQADLWLTGSLEIDQPFARQMPWPDAEWTFAPLGYRPAMRPGAIVPVYAPGLPALMAVGKAILGGCGPFVVVPGLAALTIWLTYVLGAQLWSPLVGLGGAALMATSTPFQFMVMNPMSDVPVTAFFLLGMVTALSSSRWRALWTGAAVSMAIFIRPNLVALGAIYLAFLMVRARSDDGGIARARWLTLVWFAVGGAPLVLAIAAINTALYGAPWHSGYGNVSELYGTMHFFKNIADYATWIWQKETPFIVLAAVPLIAARTVEAERRVAMYFVTAIAVGVWLSYLFYHAFGVWWYLRFLLPAFPVMLLLAVIGFTLLLRRVDSQARTAVALVVFVFVFGARVKTGREEQVPNLWKQGIAYVSAGEYVAHHLPDNAVIFAVQHSGSLRYYGHRLTMRWDYVGPEWWPRVLKILAERGYRPFVLLTIYEEQEFRERFSLSTTLDSPGAVVATLDGPEPLRIYDPLRVTQSPAAHIPQVVPCPCGSLR